MNLKHIKCFLLLTCLATIVIGNSTETTKFTSSWRNGFSKNNSINVLSRKKRFMYPVVNSPWRFDARILILVPIEGQPNQLVAFIPFTWNLNTLS